MTGTLTRDARRSDQAAACVRPPAGVVRHRQYRVLRRRPNQVYAPALWSLERIPGGAVGRRLAFMAMVDATGTGAFLGTSVIFLTRSVGLSAAQVGFGLSISAAIGLVSTLPVGALADRYGPRRILVLTSLWRAVCFVVYPFVGDFGAFLVVVCLLGLVDKTAAPMEQALVGRAVGEDARVGTMAIMRALRNVGFAAGALLASAALVVDNQASYAAVLLANAASFVALAIIAARLPLPSETWGTQLQRKISLRVLKDRPYFTLAWLNAILTMHMTLLSIGMPLWIAVRSAAPTAVVAPLLAVNTVLAVAFQVAVSKGSDSVAGASRCLVWAGVSLAACCLLLAAVPPLPAVAAIVVLTVAMVALTGGELFQSAGGWGLSFTLAPKEQQATYLSLFWLGVGVQQIAAPAVLAIVIGFGAPGWLGLAAVLLAAGLATTPASRWATNSAARKATVTEGG